MEKTIILLTTKGKEDKSFRDFLSIARREGVGVTAVDTIPKVLGLIGNSHNVPIFVDGESGFNNQGLFEIPKVRTKSFLLGTMESLTRDLKKVN